MRLTGSTGHRYVRFLTVQPKESQLRKAAVSAAVALVVRAFAGVATEARELLLDLNAYLRH